MFADYYGRQEAKADGPCRESARDAAAHMIRDWTTKIDGLRVLLDAVDGAPEKDKAAADALLWELLQTWRSR